MTEPQTSDSDDDESSEVDPLPYAQPPGGAAWFGYIGFGIVVVAMVIGVAAMGAAILYFLRHGT